MSNEYTEFWIELLQFGDDEKVRRDNWNLFCIDELKVFDLKIMDESKKQELFQRYYPPHLHKEIELNIIQDINFHAVKSKQIKSLQELADKFGGPKEISYNTESFMDFSDVQMEDWSFAGRIFIGADFQGVKFEQRANFEHAVFLGLTHFDNAVFLHEKHPIGNSFKNTEFLNTAYFKEIESAIIRFDESIFHSAGYFNHANFDSGKEISSRFVTFDKCHFNQEVKFTVARFDCASFNNAQFDNSAYFDEAEFKTRADFSNVKFNHATSFRRTVFASPPKFYDAELHEDTDFDDVDWSKAEKAYIRSSKGEGSSTSIRDEEAAAVRAWDRLILIMSQREKHVERHEFFCRKMRAQRRRDGICLLSLTNWLFEFLSGYGWDIGKAFGCWMAHIVIGAILIFCCRIPYSPEANLGWQFIQSFCLSFANAHAFLGLASTGGYLHDIRVGLYDVVWSSSYLNSIGAIQVAIGPVFLFLVLLTVRNRFRIR